MPLDDDGKTSLLLAHVDVLRQMLPDYDKKLSAPPKGPKKYAQPTPLTEIASSIEDGEIVDENTFE